ncbi:MAG: hypothetical protein EXS43_11960 [Opitutus sp.]|nr:hypothetical protein [Opitutus sp.]
MPSSVESTPPPGGNWRNWNRRLHYFLGLYFLFFIWLFALTGLLLNHGEWKFAEFFPNRKIMNSEHTIQTPAPGNPVARATDLLHQLGLAGEIDSVTSTPDEARLDFRAHRPGLQLEIKADLQAARAKVQRTDLNAWGAMRTLHTFTGVRLNDPRSQRDWILTTVWALAMDAVALGLIVLTLSGVVMWWGLPAKRKLGLLALAAGVLVCGWFVIGLRLLSP